MSRSPRARIKRGEDDDLTQVAIAASRFDPNAPSGTYKMDRTAERLIEERNILWVWPLRAMRWRIHNAFRGALSSKRWDGRFPDDCRRAADFFSKLQQIRQLASEVLATDAEQFSYLLARSWPINGANGFTLPPDKESEAVEDRIDRFKSQLAPNLGMIDRFAEDVFLPQFINDRGRAIGFTRYLIRDVAEFWRRAFGKLEQKSDLADVTELLATALTDFDYPMSPSQRKSDEWLSDRIRKQIFRN